MKGRFLAVALLLVVSSGRAPAADGEPEVRLLFDAPRLTSASAAPTKLRWSQKTLGNAAYGGHSSVAVDPSGRPHVVFAGRRKGSYVLTHSWLDGQRWKSESVDSGVEGEYSDTNVAIGADGDIHVAYAAYDTDILPGQAWRWTLRYAHKDGTGWKTETVEDGGRCNSIAVGPSGAPHILHIGGPYSDGGVRHLRRTAEGRWEGETVAEYGRWVGGTSLLFRGEKLYATFSNNSQFLLATDEAGTWQSTALAGIAGSAAFDGSGILHVVYLTFAHTLRHAWLTGGDWQEETLVSPAELFGAPLPAELSYSEPESPSLVADAGGRLHLVFGLYSDRGEGEAWTLMYATLEDTGWVPVAVRQGSVGRACAVAVSPNGLAQISAGAFTGDKSAVVTIGLQGATLSLATTPKAKGTIRVSPTGTACVGKCSEVFYPGTEVVLKAEPAGGFTFVGWSGACRGTDPTCAVTMSAGKKVTARFK